MDSSQLTPGQAEKLREAIRPHLCYLTRLRERMERRGFPGSDPLYRAVVTAQRAVQGVYTELHYLSCRGGVGRAGPERENSGSTPVDDCTGRG